MRNPVTALFAVLIGLAVLVAASDVTGKWELDVAFDDASIAGGGIDCVFKQEGERLTGSCAAGVAPLTGDIKGQTISWQMQAGTTQETITYTGTVSDSGTSMKGRFAIAGRGGNFTGLRSKSD